MQRNNNPRHQNRRSRPLVWLIGMGLAGGDGGVR